MGKERISQDSAYDLIEDGPYGREMFLNRFEVFRNQEDTAAIIYDVVEDDFTRIAGEELYAPLRSFFRDRGDVLQPHRLETAVTYRLDGSPHDFRKQLDRCDELVGYGHDPVYRLSGDSQMTVELQRYFSEPDTVVFTSAGTGQIGASVPDELFEDLEPVSVELRELESGPVLTFEESAEPVIRP